MSKFGESGQIMFPQKFLKIISVKFMDRNLGQKCHYLRKFGQNRSFFVKWSKLGHFCIIWRAKFRHMSTFWESDQKIISLKVSKNYFSQVYGHIFGQNCH